MLCRVQPGSLRGGRRQLTSVGHAGLLVALGRELPPCRGHRQPCESSRAAAAVSVFGAAHFGTLYSPLTLFQADTSRTLCCRCETSSQFGKAGVGLHQAVVAKVAPTRGRGTVLLPELIYFCSLVLPSALHTRLTGFPRAAGSLWLLKVDGSFPRERVGVLSPSLLPSSLPWMHQHPLARGSGFWAACSRAGWGDTDSLLEAAAAKFAADQILCHAAESMLQCQREKRLFCPLVKEGGWRL